MAAISALMLSDNNAHREPYEEEHASPLSRATARGAQSLTSNTIRYTISNDGAQHGRPEYVSAGGSNTDIPGPQLHHSTSDGHSGESMSDAMDIDRLRNDQDVSDDDDDTEQGEAGSASKKKKGQRFFCTGYPPCNLSFTRSEHLARHIRKHTGERPFQCHCNRRFSRLDNLRQHAQTVHVNEEIPTDSLAATGTRFQRQIRTDRVRPSGRPRTSTMSSTGSHSHSRGHSRNLSASSVGSTSSNFSTSTVSTIDPRRRPPPLLMAGDGRPKLGLDAPSTPPPQFSSYSTHSPNDITTPTSATFSTIEGSPGFSTSVGSPLTSSQRGGFFGASRAPARRLSVPSGPPPPQQTYMSPYASPYGPNSGYSSTTLSTNHSAIASPTSSTFSYATGYGFSAPSSEEWRRRTWHPSTYSANSNYNRPATSHLTYSQTPDAPRPTFAPNATAAAGHAPRLPGIESFDQVQQRPTTPPRHKQPTNAHLEQPPSLMPAAELERKLPAQPPNSHPVASKHVLEIGPQPGQERTETSWVQETIDQIHQIHAQAANRKVEMPHQSMGPPATTIAPSQPVVSDSTNNQPNRNRVKRQGWYAGPLPASRTSPEDSSISEGVPTPGTSNADVHPVIMHSNGILEPQHAMIQMDGNQNACFAPTHNLPPPYTDPSNLSRGSPVHHRRSSGTELNRLDALVAVATSETNASR